VYEVDPLACPKCGGVMKVVAFIEPPQGAVIEKRGHRRVRGGLLIFADGESARGRSARIAGFALGKRLDWPIVYLSEASGHLDIPFRYGRTSTTVEKSNFLSVVS
jgi:hypothetical protein